MDVTISGAVVNDMERSIKISHEDTRFDEMTTGVIVKLSGELGFLDSKYFMREIPEIATEKGRKIVFDMENLDYIDSAGLGSILFVSEALRMQGQKLFIVNANDYCTKVLKQINNVGTFVIEE